MLQFQGVCTTVSKSKNYCTRFPKSARSGLFQYNPKLQQTVARACRDKLIFTNRTTGAAGFEPAIPGLGGQCIIQSMLHARFAELTPHHDACPDSELTGATINRNPFPQKHGYRKRTFTSSASNPLFKQIITRQYKCN